MMTVDQIKTLEDLEQFIRATDLSYSIEAQNGPDVWTYQVRRLPGGVPFLAAWKDTAFPAPSLEQLAFPAQDYVWIRDHAFPFHPMGVLDCARVMACEILNGRQA